MALEKAKAAEQRLPALEQEIVKLQSSFDRATAAADKARAAAQSAQTAAERAGKEQHILEQTLQAKSRKQEKRPKRFRERPSLRKPWQRPSCRGRKLRMLKKQRLRCPKRPQRRLLHQNAVEDLRRRHRK